MREIVMSLLLSVICGWLAPNVVIVAALYFKPLRARGFWRSPQYGLMAFARDRRSRRQAGTFLHRHL
jgi:hypothetical protein